MSDLFFVPTARQVLAFAGGFFILPKTSDILSMVVEERGLFGVRMTRPAFKGITTVLSFGIHFFAKGAMSLGWFLGEANDMLGIASEAVAREVAPRAMQQAMPAPTPTPAPAPGVMAGFTGRAAGARQGGITGRQVFGKRQGGITGRQVFGRRQGQVGADQLRTLREQLGTTRANGGYAAHMVARSR